MEGMKNLLSAKNIYDLIWSVVFIIGGVVLWKLLKKMRDTMLEKLGSDDSKESIRRRATINRISNFIKFGIIILDALVVLQLNGVNVSAILASLGIAGAIAGLAWQDMFKDLIQGFRIVSDSMFSVGDYVIYGGEEYRIIDFSMRTTRMQSLKNNDVRIICNREITSITKMSGQFFIYLRLSYDDDTEKIEQLLKDCAEEIAKLKLVKKCEYLGLREFLESGIEYQLAYWATPKNKYSGYRAAMKILRSRLGEAGIEIPVDQLDIHERA